VKKALVLVALALLMPSLAAAQGARLQLDQLSALGRRAKEVVDVTLDPAMLKLATGFLSAGKGNDNAIKDVIAGLQGIYVKVFEFENDGAYSSADVESVRKQFAAPGWARMVVVNSKEERETVDIYAWRQGDRAGGIGILVAEPRELTVVNIVGDIDLARLAALQGQFGIPALPLDGKAPATRGK
jgi:hypothetical protein